MSGFKLGALVFAAALAGFGAVHAKGGNDGRWGSGKMIERMCSATPDASRAERMGERMSSRMSLTDAQKALLKDVRDTRSKAREESRAAICGQKPDLATFSGRMSFQEKMLEARLAALKATRPKVEAFYNSLDDKQKAMFTSNHHFRGEGGRHYRRGKAE